MAPPSKGPTKQWRVDHAGKINKTTFTALIWAFFALGIFACFVRLYFRLKTQRRLFHDDILILLATAFFVAETGVLSWYTNRIYILEAAKGNPPILPTLPELETLTYSTAWLDVYNSLGWAAVFAIKGSFLVIFWPLLRGLSRGIIAYFWFGVTLTIISWIMITCEPFILCPHFGTTSFQCATIADYPLYLGMSLMVFLLDIATDVIIISIPLVLLRIARSMQLPQKIRIATFLCLSAAMVVISLVRIGGGWYTDFEGKREISFAWSHILLHIEAGVGVLMGTISAFRSVFKSPRTSFDQERSRPPSFLARILNKLGLGYITKSFGNSSSSGTQHPQLPRDGQNTRLTMFSLRRFIRRQGRDPGQTTLASIDDPQEHYHEFMRREAEGARSTRALDERESASRPSENTDAIELAHYPATSTVSSV